MENEKLKQLLREIDDLFIKHDIDELTQRVGVLEIAKNIYLLTANTMGMAKCLEDIASKKASEVSH